MDDGRETLINSLLTLYVCNTAKKVTYVKDTRLQKAVFLSQIAMAKDKCQGFGFDFIKYHYGPFSPQLTSELAHLLDLDFLRKNRFGYSLTQRGISLLNQFRSLFTRNRHQMNHIKKYTQEIMEDDFERMLAQVYDRQNPLNSIMTIEETPLEEPLLLGNYSFTKDFKITDTELEDLSMILDEEYQMGMAGSRKSLDEGNFVVWTPLSK